MGLLALLVLAAIAFVVIGLILHLIKFALIVALILLGVAFVTSKLPSNSTRNR